MPRKKTQLESVIPSAPEPKEQPAQEQFKSVEEAVNEAVDKRNYEGRFGQITKGQELIMAVMIGTIVVLFVGFVTLIFALGSIMMQWWGFNSNIQGEMIKSINQETQTVNKFNADLKELRKIITITPTAQ